MKTSIDIEVSEVGPRDGLQSIEPIMATKDKKRWISALAAAGLPEIEVGSFVPKSILPQLADTAELVEHALSIEGLTIAVLVPNLRGAEGAIKAGAHKISIPLSVSETHSLKNVRRSHAQMLEEVKSIRALIDDQPQHLRPKFEGSLSTAFGCTLEGTLPETLVFSLAEALMEAGCDEVGLSDTTGFGTPKQVKNLTLGVWNAVGKENLNGIHLHNTRGQGFANVMSALDVGLTTIDSSMAGIGGCPFAPGASGNIVTEDLIFLLEGQGLKTGVNFERLLKARNILRDSLPAEVELYGFTTDAGLPKDFEMATPQ